VLPLFDFEDIVYNRLKDSDNNGKAAKCPFIRNRPDMINFKYLRYVCTAKEEKCKYEGNQLKEKKFY
jgi:hypothetical protein